MSFPEEELPDWERLLAAERHLQHVVPGAVLVGGTEAALRPFDAIYEQAGGASPLAEVAERLAAAAPTDAAGIDLPRYRALRAPWNDWTHVVTRGRHWAPVVARVVLEERR